MNNDLISRKAAVDALSYCGRITVREARAEIMALPAVDTELVRHGIWEPDPVVFVCSECHKWFEVVQGNADMNYCPHCGTRMDGGAE